MASNCDAATIGSKSIPCIDTVIAPTSIKIDGVTYSVESGVRDERAFAKSNPENRRLEQAVIAALEDARGFPWDIDVVERYFHRI